MKRLKADAIVRNVIEKAKRELDNRIVNEGILDGNVIEKAKRELDNRIVNEGILDGNEMVTLLPEDFEKEQNNATAEFQSKRELDNRIVNEGILDGNEMVTLLPEDFENKIMQLQNSN